MMDPGIHRPTSPAPSGGKSDAYKPFKELTPRHERIMEMHLAGRRNTEIAEVVGVSTSRVSIILHNPTVQMHLVEVREAAQEELKKLIPSAVRVLQRALDNSDPKVALKATDLLFRTQGMYREPSEPRETAEDVIQRALEIIKGEPSVRMIQARRLPDIKQHAPRG